MPRRQMRADLDKRDVDFAGDEGENFLGVRLDPPRAPVPALRTRPAGAARAPPLRPLDGRRRGNPEPGRRLTAAQPAVDRGNHAGAQIL